MEVSKMNQTLKKKQNQLLLNILMAVKFKKVFFLKENAHLEFYVMKRVYIQLEIHMLLTILSYQEIGLSKWDLI